MEYITIDVPPLPFYIMSGSALYRPGDYHRKRTNIGCFDILFVDYGDLHMDDGNNRYRLNKNDVLILHPDRTHYGFEISKEKTYFHWLHFYTKEPFLFSDEIKNTGASVKGETIYETAHAKLIIPACQTLSADIYHNIISLLKEMEGLHIDKYAGNSRQLLRHTDFMQDQLNFLKIMNMLCMNQNQENTGSIAYYVMNYLHANYSRYITLDQLAKLVNCHPTHLIRCFKAEYHMTPWQALIRIRIQQAAHLLTATNLSCLEITQQCGFQSVPYFSNTFKKYWKTTPTEYRKRELREAANDFIKGPVGEHPV